MSQTITKIPVGISSCLLGEQVRYDGGHRYDPFINKQLADYFEFRPFCPEVAIGLGIPRAPIQLVKTASGVRVKGVDNPALDVTDRLAHYGLQVAQDMDDICGYIFKARSPSCGMEHVKTWRENGAPDRSDGIGVYAQAIMRAHPNLPVEEEDQLNDPALCDNFIEQVFTFHRRLQRGWL
jgi:uncharacterized protein YbbK (DUF523 family)